MTLSRASFQAFLFFLIAAALYGRRAAATRDNERPLDYHYQAGINHPSTSFSFPTFAEPSQYEHVMHTTGTMQPTTGGSPDMFHFGASPPFLAPVYGSAGPSTSAGELPSSSRRGYRQGRASVPEQLVVPPLKEGTVTPNEEWHLWRLLRTKLARWKVSPDSLHMVQPRNEARNMHLELLQKQLQLQLSSKHVVPLGPTIDIDGRIFATPIQNEELKDVILKRNANQNVAWAFFSIRYDPRPKMTWEAYALLEGTAPAVLNGILEGNHHVNTLEKYLTRF